MGSRRTGRAGTVDTEPLGMVICRNRGDFQVQFGLRDGDFLVRVEGDCSTFVCVFHRRRKQRQGE